MYLEHFNLRIKPFDLSLKPAFLWLGEKHAEALATLQYGIQEDLGFLLMTGDVGAGKTVLIRRLVNSLDKSTIVVHITDPGLEAIEFFKVLAAEFNIPGGFKSKADFLLQFDTFLRKAASEKKKVLLIVDEAQRLNDSLLDQIRVLSNIELGNRKLINIFFVGQPEFKNMLMTDTNRPLRQRIAVNYHIDPLSQPEVGEYIRHRLLKAGCKRNLFNPDAIREIFRFTNGYPRAINIICDHALLTGFSNGLNTIDSNVIKECKQELAIHAEAEVDEGGNKFHQEEEEEEKKTDEPAPIPPEHITRTSDLKKTKSSFLGGYSLIIGICTLLIVALVYLLMRPGPDDSNLEEIVQTERTEESDGLPDGPTEPLPNNQWRLEDKIEMDKTYASSTSPQSSMSQTSSTESLPEPGTKNTFDSAMDTDSTMKDGHGTLTEASEPEPVSLAPPPTAQPDTQKETAELNAATVETGKTDAGTSGAQEASPDQLQQESKKNLADPGVTAHETVAIPHKSLKAMAEMSAALTTKPEVPPESYASNISTPKAKTAATIIPEPRTVNNAATTETLPNKARTTTTLKKKAVNPNTPGSMSLSSKPETNMALAAVIASSQEKNKSAPPVKSFDSTTAPAAESTKAMTSKPTTSATASPQAGQSASSATTAPAAAVTTTAASTGKKQSASSQKPNDKGLENRIRWFLKSYCVTYAKKDLDAFTKFFVPGATENGKSFESLIPKYKRNFEHIETIQYRIDLKDFSYDDEKESINVDGDFSLQWLPGDRKWRENSGTIAMTLIESGQSFLVQSLTYKGSRPKK